MQRRDTVKLFSYSTEVMAFAEAKWMNTRFVTVGILIGVIIFFGFIKLNQSFDHAFWSRSSYLLAVENEILRQQMRMISPRVHHLEIQTRHLDEFSNELYVLLHPGMVAGDTVSRYTIAIKNVQVPYPGSNDARFHP